MGRESEGGVVSYVVRASDGVTDFWVRWGTRWSGAEYQPMATWCTTTERVDAFAFDTTEAAQAAWDTLEIDDCEPVIEEVA